MFDKTDKYYSKSGLKIVPDIISGRATILLLIGISLLFGLLIWWLNHTLSLQNIWDNFTLDKKVPASFCEQLHLNNPVRQPVNTFSNIIYLVTAIIILKTNRKERYMNIDGRLSVSNGYSALLGIILLYVFGASTFYHASLISIAHTLDYSAVFSFSLFPVMFLISQRCLTNRDKLSAAQKKKSKILFFSAFLIINLMFFFLIPKGKESVVASILVILFLAMALATVIFEKKKTGLRYLILSITSVLIAVLWFELDKYKILCNPTGYFQPHSLWNIFIGLSAFCFYLYMRTESNQSAIILKINNN